MSLSFPPSFERLSCLALSHVRIITTNHVLLDIPYANHAKRHGGLMTSLWPYLVAPHGCCLQLLDAF
jgi:hypothetical protein